MTTAPTIDEMIACAKREVRFRKTVLRHEEEVISEADGPDEMLTSVRHGLACMEAIVRELEKLREKETSGA